MRAEGGFELAHPESSTDFETVNVLVNGKARLDSWAPIPFKLISSDQGEILEPADAPWLGSHVLVLKEKAVDALYPLLVGAAEFLPVECQTNLWLLNPLAVVDALDVEKSEVVSFSDGRIMDITRHVFRSGAIGDLPCFKVPNLRVSPTFVTKDVVNAFQARALTGTAFHLVWQSR